jgi:hypothetical protein
MICALCLKREANKTNTHYLSDSVIRTALNKDGGNERDTGFYFGIETGMKYIDFNFQRATPIPALEEALGRLPEEDEIVKAKDVPFSVDYVFCSFCEDIFTSIEERFTPKLLKYFRDTNFENLDKVTIKGDDILNIRWFFLLQVWRTHVCEPDYNIEPATAEALRTIILNSQEEDIKRFPISIIYLNTLGGPKEYTRNLVGTTNDRNPSIIFINDFIIQFYEDLPSVRFDPLYGFNTKEDYIANINIDEDEFIVKVIPDDRRKALLFELTKSSGSVPNPTEYILDFQEEYSRIYKVYPSLILLLEYIKGFTSMNEKDLLQLTEKRVKSYMHQFIQSHSPNK